MPQIRDLEYDERKYLVQKRKRDYQLSVDKLNRSKKPKDFVQIVFDKNTIHINEINKKIRDAKTKLTLEVPTQEQIKVLREQSLDNFWSYTTFKYRESQQAQYEEMMKAPDSAVQQSVQAMPSVNMKDYIALKHFSGTDTLSFAEYCDVTFSTPNGLPEIINDICQYLFKTLPQIDLHQ